MLVLSDKQLTELPNTIENLTKLTELYLEDNHFFKLGYNMSNAPSSLKKNEIENCNY